jgi:hypothetical protein
MVIWDKEKTGEIYGVIRDTKTGKNQSFLTLDKKLWQT